MITTTAPDTIAVARSLRAEIAAYAEDAERQRRLPDGLLALLRKHELMAGMARPIDRGGLGLDLITTMRTVEEISTADASTGWCVAIDSQSIGTIPLREDVAREVYKRGSSVCGVGNPTGRAIPVDGGFRLSGRWAYASGSRHSQWIGLGCVVFDGDKPRLTASGAPEMRMCVLPIGDVEILDTWIVSGLRATGSNDIAADSVFVPEERTAAIALGSSPQADGAYRLPMFTLFGLALVTVALGAARHAIDEFVALAQGKTPMLQGTKLRDKPVVQYEVARAEGILEAGRAYLYAAVAELQDRASHEGEIDLALKAKVKLACTVATDCSLQAVEIAYRLGGGTSNYETSPLQRCMRDVHAVTQHFAVAASNYETVGRVLLGLDPGTPLI